MATAFDVNVWLAELESQLPCLAPDNGAVPKTE